MKELVIEKQQKVALVSVFRDVLTDELDVEVGALQAEMLIDRLAESLGPVFYNQGLRDAHAVILRRIEDAAGDIDQLERQPPYK